MTNRQWLVWQMIDMSDEELTEFLGCVVCSKYVKKNKPCPKDCDAFLLAWLKQEHEEAQDDG